MGDGLVGAEPAGFADLVVVGATVDGKVAASQSVVDRVCVSSGTLGALALLL